MKRVMCTVALSLLAACSAREESEESLGDSREALNGSLSSEGFLVRRSIASTNEFTRQQDTTSYYNGARVGVGWDGSGSSIGQALPTLAAFKTHYGFGSGHPEATTYYYNRGDLGLGREMRCVDRSVHDGQIACYVSNYAAGDADTEFTFGLSANVAFANMALGRVVATVAMVHRRHAASNKDKLLFMVYNEQGQLTKAAPLDRHGLNFAVAQKKNGNVQPDPAVFGQPGVQFNNHIPTNCLNCHGGTYNTTTREVSGAFFLPFDLDQFEYEDVTGRRRADQLVAFRKLNEMVRKVAVRSAGNTHPIVKQLDGWYNNPTTSETLSNDFNPAFVPAGWAEAPGVYYDVVRRSCRGCHMAFPLAQSQFRFETSSDFLALAQLSVNRLDNHSMPHALQTQRDFWQSMQPQILESYFRANGQSVAADALRNAGPDDLVTLDPPAIAAATL